MDNTTTLQEFERHLRRCYSDRSTPVHYVGDVRQFQRVCRNRLQVDTCTALARSAGAGVTWSWKLTDAQRGGLTTRLFARYQLMRSQTGHELTHNLP